MDSRADFRASVASEPTGPILFAGWINRQQQAAIDHLIEENRVLRQQLGTRRLRFIDAQRRRLAERGKVLGRAASAELNTIVTPDTILRWYRKLVRDRRQ
jgi:hypothetical protein